MNYYWLLPQDPTLDVYLLYEIDPKEDRLRVRRDYMDLVCRGCGKVDELSAIQRGVSIGGLSCPPPNTAADLISGGFRTRHAKGSRHRRRTRACAARNEDILRAS